MKVNLFVDMDGVLATYKEDIEMYMQEEGFFLNRPPMTKMVEVVKELIKTDYNIYILSSVIDTPYCVPEKKAWLNKYLPEIAEVNRVFVPYGTVKSSFAEENVDTRNAINVLIDDYTENLVNWKLPGSLPIKVMNGVNSNNGTWVDLEGSHINAFDSCELNVSKIIELIDERV